MTETGTYPQRRYRPPAGACDMLLIRHGASEPAHPDRPFPLKDGHGDPALAPEGQAQAQQVASRLGGHPIDALYVTTLRRTHQTAAPLARALGLTPEVEPDLREVCLGEWDAGIYRKMVADNHPVIQRMHETQDWGVIPGAESAAIFGARVRAGIERIAARHGGQTVAVVAHGGTIAMALALAAGAGAFTFTGADNGSISRLVIADGRWIIRGFNDCAHLDG
ncbi:histidine phosphatase family protein [Marinibacterium sp. SX1]|uniref:histidine phosphatase family protein n=1 Tax=Marinibacterium sp. SX1 TaxID=3388424 RepID=UPI003D176969